MMRYYIGPVNDKRTPEQFNHFVPIWMIELKWTRMMKLAYKCGWHFQTWPSSPLFVDEINRFLEFDMQKFLLSLGSC